MKTALFRIKRKISRFACIFFGVDYRLLKKKGLHWWFTLIWESVLHSFLFIVLTPVFWGSKLFEKIPNTRKGVSKPIK